jgi:transcription antitermination protein NusB
MARKRSRARGWALQVLYAWETRGERDRLPDLLNEFLSTRRVGVEAREYLETLISTVDLYLERIDEAVAGSLLNWRLERLSIIDRNVLRLGAAEMLHLAIPRASPFRRRSCWQRSTVRMRVHAS